MLATGLSVQFSCSWIIILSFKPFPPTYITRAKIIDQFSSHLESCSKQFLLLSFPQVVAIYSVLCGNIIEVTNFVTLRLSTGSFVSPWGLMKGWLRGSAGGQTAKSSSPLHRHFGWLLKAVLATYFNPSIQDISPKFPLAVDKSVFVHEMKWIF